VKQEQQEWEKEHEEYDDGDGLPGGCGDDGVGYRGNLDKQECRRCRWQSGRGCGVEIRESFAGHPNHRHLRRGWQDRDPRHSRILLPERSLDRRSRLERQEGRIPRNLPSKEVGQCPGVFPGCQTNRLCRIRQKDGSKSLSQGEYRRPSHCGLG